MMKNNIEKLKEACYGYRLKNDYELTERLLSYIEQRILANKAEIEELIKIKKKK